MNQVVITGVGVVSSIGNGIDSFWDSLKAGKSGITEVTRFEAGDIASQVASEVTDFNPEDFACSNGCLLTEAPSELSAVTALASHS